MSALRRRLAGEDGFVGGFEVLPFGVLVLIVGLLLLVNAWAVVDANLAAGSAAREAVRAFVEDVGTTASARASGEEAAREALAGHGKDAERADIGWDGALVRCQAVTASVTYRMPLLAVPWIGAFGDGVVSTTASHTEVVDPYRAGLAVTGFDAEACRG